MIPERTILKPNDLIQVTDGNSGEPFVVQYGLLVYTGHMAAMIKALEKHCLTLEKKVGDLQAEIDSLKTKKVKNA